MASTIPATLAAVFPGAVYLKQSVRFRAPVLAGSEVETRLQVVTCSGRRAAFSTTVRVVGEGIEERGEKGGCGDGDGEGDALDGGGRTVAAASPLRVLALDSPPEIKGEVAIDGEALTLLPIGEDERAR